MKTNLTVLIAKVDKLEKTANIKSNENLYTVLVEHDYEQYLLAEVRVGVPVPYMDRRFYPNFYSDLKEASRIRVRGIDVFDYWVERVACVLGKFYGVDRLIGRCYT